MSAAAVRRLDVARADRITARLSGAADLMLDLVAEAYAGEVWTVYGLPSWAAYVAAKVPALSVIGRGLPLEERRDAVAVLRGRGLSLRAVSDVLGIAPNTVRTDAAARDVAPAEVISLDGSRRSSSSTATAARRRRTPLTDRVITLLTSAGPDGRTVRDVARELRVERHLIAPTLTRLEDAGRIFYRRPERRGQFGTYVAGRIR